MAHGKRLNDTRCHSGSVLEIVGAKSSVAYTAQDNGRFKRVLDPCIVCDVGLHKVVNAHFVLDTIGIELVLI